jgi:hypothetical protein
VRNSLYLAKRRPSPSRTGQREISMWTSVAATCQMGEKGSVEQLPREATTRLESNSEFANSHAQLRINVDSMRDQ